MKKFIFLAALLALAACPKKSVEDPKPVEDAAQIEDGGGEDVVVMDALVIDGSLPD
jgi:hypothetical protein